MYRYLHTCGTQKNLTVDDHRFGAKDKRTQSGHKSHGIHLRFRSAFGGGGGLRGAHIMSHTRTVRFIWQTELGTSFHIQNSFGRLTYTPGMIGLKLDRICERQMSLQFTPKHDINHPIWAGSSPHLHDPLIPVLVDILGLFVQTVKRDLNLKLHWPASSDHVIS